MLTVIAALLAFCRNLIRNWQNILVNDCISKLSLMWMFLCKNIFICVFSVHTIYVYTSWTNDATSWEISRNVVSFKHTCSWHDKFNPALFTYMVQRGLCVPFCESYFFFSGIHCIFEVMEPNEIIEQSIFWSPTLDHIR